MNLRAPLAAMLDRTADRVAQLVQGLSEQDVSARLHGLAPIKWQVGHIATIESKGIARVGGVSPVPEAYLLLFDTGTGSEGTYPPLADLLSIFAKCNEETRAFAFEGDLNRPVAGVRSYSTGGEALLFLTYHRGYHIGKISTLRALLGKRL